MGRGRRLYYDVFSRFYDRFVALHSRDTGGAARRFLADHLPEREDARVLDLCTGTGSVLPFLSEKTGRSGQAIGLDFSHGMLLAARNKTRSCRGVGVVEGDASALPFVDGSFAAVTCSHAFYELKGEVQETALREVLRVLEPGGLFLMMEHDVPPKGLVRAVYLLRLVVAGGSGAVSFLKREREVLETFFATVERVTAPAGRTKLMVCGTRGRDNRGGHGEGAGSDAVATGQEGMRKVKVGSGRPEAVRRGAEGE